MAKWAEIPISQKSTSLKCYKLFKEAHLPILGSEWAACFDLRASLLGNEPIKYYDEWNLKKTATVEDGNISFYSGQRMLVPTGLIFNLPEDMSMRIHPRSGLSLKSGIIIANCEGVVDSDYVEQTYVMLHNASMKTFIIEDGMRIAQAELVYNDSVRIEEIFDRPEQKTSRKGGFGSTGL